MFRDVENPKCKGNFIKQPCFTITRDGFTFLAMGFTGKKAAQFKEAYINAFNQMEQALVNRKEEIALTNDKSNNNLLEGDILDKINVIDPNNFDTWQYYYMNNPILKYSYFRFKIDKNTKLPLIQMWDWYKIIGEEKNYLHPRQFKHSVNPNDPEFKRYLDPAYMETETISFEGVYSWAEFCKEDKLYKTIQKHLDDFKTKYKNILDNSLLEKIQSGNRQLKNNISPNSNFLEEKKIFSF
jgi:RecG-like helicase